MQIHYRNKKLRELCEHGALAERKLGAACARKLRARLSDLEAADNVSQLQAGHPHPLRGDREGQFALDLSGGWRLVFAPVHEPLPQGPDGATDWSRVTIICIEYIGNYHD